MAARNKKKSGRGKTKTMKGQVIFFLFYAELMKCFNSIITVNWVMACKSSGLHNYTLIVLYTSCHETDSRQASTIRATDTDRHGLWKLVFRIHQPVPMYSGDSVEDEGSVQPLSLSPHADHAFDAAVSPPIPLWSSGKDSAVLHCAMQFQLEFPYELNRECSPLIV